jgi:rubrerythrin
MFVDVFHGQKRPPQSGITNLSPEKVNSGIAVLLAQAETLKRLRREADLKRKLLWAMAIASDCCEAYPESALAKLNVARIARSAGAFDFAARMLNQASRHKANEQTVQNIQYEKNLLVRENEIAGGSLVAMAQRLLVYACQRCGRLIEYIAVPCMYCGWRPTTPLEVSHSGRLMTPRFNVWELLDIGRQIHAGRKPTEIVINLADAAAEDIADPQSWYRGYVEDVIERVKSGYETYLCYIEVSMCKNCGTHVHRQDASQCPKCNAPVQMPPPLRLLNCLTRLSLHFQHNFHAPKSSEFELFIRYPISLQSKLYRLQETPSDRERAQVLTMMSKLGRFDVVNDLGAIDMTNPKTIAVLLHKDLPETKKVLASTVLRDFRDALQFLADWMSRRKALC